MDALGWLRLQLEWGADEALADAPVDRRTAPARAGTGDGRPARSRAPILPAGAGASPLATGAGALARAHALAADAGTLAELRQALAGFDGCALRATATSLVFSDGDPAARMVLLADVPGPAEDRAGVPFAGPAAAFLDRMLASIGLDRAALSGHQPAAVAAAGRPQAGRGRGAALPAVPVAPPAAVQPRRSCSLFGNFAVRTLLPGAGRAAAPVGRTCVCLGWSGRARRWPSRRCPHPGHPASQTRGLGQPASACGALWNTAELS